MSESARRDPVTVALFQMTSGIDPHANAAAIADAARDAAEGGAAMLFTPEMCGLLDRDRKRATPNIVAESSNPVLAGARSAARAFGIWIDLGSLAILRDDGRWANRGFVIDADGEIVARYDKIHMFDVDLATGESWRESAAYAPGEQVVTVEASAWVVATAQVGRHEDGRETYGHSLVIDPWGDVALDMGDAAGLGFAKIDAERTASVRAQLPSLANKREIPRSAA